MYQQHYLKYLVLHFLIIYHLASGSTIKKTRACKEYEIRDFWDEAEESLVIPEMEKGDCFIQCGFELDCVAFNYDYHDGICHLLSGISSCMKPVITEGVIYGSLAPCIQRAPWFSKRPDDINWEWIMTDDPYARNDLVGDGTRYASRVYYRGLYLPGWWDDSLGYGLFRATMPGENVVECENGEFLAVPDPGRVIWSPVPVNGTFDMNAVIAGYGPDSMPLYITKKMISAVTTFGAYDANNQIAYFNKDGFVESTPGEILSVN